MLHHPSTPYIRPLTSFNSTRFVTNTTINKAAHASWEPKIGYLSQNPVNLWASAACSSGPITPPVATSGNLEKLRALDLLDSLMSPSIAAIATRTELLISPANARINMQANTPSAKPMLLFT